MKLVKLILIIAAFTTNLNAQEAEYEKLEKITSMGNLENFITFYYTSPKPKLVPNAILFIRDKNLTSNSNLERHFVPFFGEVFKNNEENIPIWFESLTKLSDDDIFIFSQALLWSDSKYSKLTIENLLKKTKNKELINSINNISNEMKPMNLLEVEISSAEQLDMLWNSFFATGNEKFIEKILLTSEIANKPLNQIIISQTARWSIKANSKVHTKVRDFCNKNKKNYSENINLFLQSISE
ncbi:hypothetical protein EHR01_06530 [Leptospira mtsangambouensis]|uniref:DUF2059 domain-containing protein n=1 Tax=Leptospira mtsangambouensis TaxID=2484912 RepID=A0ABY2P4M9_9LEPT|nr:hypothetical protein [Leptospira mtsangambouensis]TGM82431.1 hypothetical protein EHR01_06530 [Leptospira mtsangambouensis]